MPQTENKKKTKKILIISLVVIAIVSLGLYLLTLIIPKIYQMIKPEETELIAEYSFYEADYDEDIFEDEYYMSLIKDGVLEYDDNSSFKTTITQEDAYSYGEGVGVITDMVYAAINGDADTYNSYFSSKYFETNEPKSAFTMQKIYDGEIIYFSGKTVTEGDVTYTRYVYELRYSILENNGTFRKDMGDWQRPQYVVITDREGKMLIDGFMYEKTK